MLIVVVGVPVVFPDGRLPGPRWRWLSWSATAAVTCLFLGNVVSPHTQEARLARWHNPVGLPGRFGGIASALSAAGVLLATADRRRSHRRARPALAARRAAGPPAAAVPRAGRLPAGSGVPHHPRH